MIKEINTKGILVKNKQPSGWFGCNYLFNIYRGCEHRCIYCDSRSLCYQIENFEDVLVKTNAPDLLEKELKSRRKKGTIGTGSMSDPYTLCEKKYGLTRKCLEIINDHKYTVHITTKSNLVLRDADILQEINKRYASVAMTITTSDNNLSKKIEPCAPCSDERFKALGILSLLGLTTSITLMPVLPFIEDNEENITEIINKAAANGVKHVVPFLGMTLRDRQRAYYYEKLDILFPGTKEKYIKKFKSNYTCYDINYKKLMDILKTSCSRHKISLKMPSYEEKLSNIQLSFLDI